MANDATDEALNADHHLDNAIVMLTSQRAADPRVVRRLVNASDELERALELMLVPPKEPARRWIRFWPTRVR